MNMGLHNDNICRGRQGHASQASMAKEPHMLVFTWNMTTNVRCHCTKPADEDTELMLRARDGDSAAFARLYERYLPLATAYAANFGDGVTSAEDIAQEVFMRLWDRRRDYRGQAKVRTYIFAYIYNVCLEEGRLRTKHKTLSDLLCQNSRRITAVFLAPEEKAIRTETNERLGRALSRLSETQRQALRLRYIEGMSVQDAARFAGCTVKCFESRLSRSREKLRCLFCIPDERQGDEQSVYSPRKSDKNRNRMQDSPDFCH
jgi:RNA polymerase sigma-70 factor (ECF subfamily)